MQQEIRRQDIYNAVINARNNQSSGSTKQFNIDDVEMLISLANVDQETLVTVWNYAMMETGKLNLIHHNTYHTMSRLNEFRHQEYAEDLYVVTDELSANLQGDIGEYFMTDWGTHSGAGIYQYRTTQPDFDTSQIDNIVKIKQLIFDDTSNYELFKMIDTDFLLGFLKYKNITTPDINKHDFKERIKSEYEQVCLDNAIKWNFNEHHNPDICTRTTNDVIVHFEPHEVNNISINGDESTVEQLDEQTLLNRNLDGKVSGMAIVELRVVREGFSTIYDYESAYIFKVPFTGHLARAYNESVDLHQDSTSLDIAKNSKGNQIKALQIVGVELDLNNVQQIQKANVVYEEGLGFWSDQIDLVSGNSRAEYYCDYSNTNITEQETQSIKYFMTEMQNNQHFNLANHANYMLVNQEIEHPMIDNKMVSSFLDTVNNEVHKLEAEYAIQNEQKLTHQP